ncbi:MAG: hypothetical protein RL442_984, partial [Pseudomonadota bacterium]
MSFMHQSDLSHTPSGMQRRQVLGGLTGALATAVLSHNAWAQESFPNRPIRVIVPQPPGGGFDFVARALADRLGKSLGQSIVV